MKSFFYLILLIGTLNMSAQDSSTYSWMRYSAISPDGNSIVFSYKGDLYKVPTSGGDAIPLTLHNAHDYMPVWSHDGKHIAFASDRYGDFDVYIMPSSGGAAERLTYHSSADHPSEFSIDNKRVLFTSSRLDNHKNQQFPSGVLPELYSVPATGGRVFQEMTTPAENTRLSTDGNLYIFHDRKGYEDSFRKHHTSSVTRDIWSFHKPSGKYTQLTTFDGEDRNPVFSPDQSSIYYLSEAAGTFNVFKMNLNAPDDKKQISYLDKHPIRYLTISNNGMLCFSYHGNIYTMIEGGTPQQVDINITSGDRYNAEKIEPIKGNVSEVAVSPNGKEIAYIVRGEVFVSSVKEGTAKRITNTPEQERSISFSNDGRSILYASERNGSWNIYESSIKRKEEKYFFNATVIDEKVVIDSPEEEFQPAYSPDGKEVAYLAERTAIKVINLASKEVRLVMPAEKNYSYSDGDQHFDWSPDSKWLLVEFLQPNQWITQAGLVKADGSEEVINLTKSGYGNYVPKWMMGGKMMAWVSDRDGMKNDASWGGELDVYGMFFTQEAYDEFKLTEEEYEIASEDEKAEMDAKAKAESDAKKNKESSDISDIKIEFDNLKDRKVKLTVHSSRLNDAYVTPDGKYLFYLARYEKGIDLWRTNLRTRETKKATKVGQGNASLIPDHKGKNLFIVSSGSITKYDISSEKTSSVSVSGEMILKEYDERDYLFEHIWRQVDKKFYKKNIHDVEWEFYKKEYAAVLPHINNNYDFAEMLSEMLGELNASHTGARYRPRNNTADRTASLGLFYDHSYKSDGLMVAEVMDKSPIVKSDSKIKAGIIIEAIDGILLSQAVNHHKILNRKAGENTLLALYDPSTGNRWEEVVKPITKGAENELLYQRWVKRCKEIVEKASDGKVGYVHVRGMNDRSFRTVYEEVLGENAGKESLIVDTRFNGGGWLHDDLATFLSGIPYITFMPRGQNLGTEPQFKWTKPSAVIMGESNYSDAHMFPYTYKALGIGKLIGMPVPGTGTAVWWEQLQNGMVFGIPQVGMVDVDGEYLENKQLEPDVKVANDPEMVSNGQDQQLEVAVKELMKEDAKTIRP